MKASRSDLDFLYDPVNHRYHGVYRYSRRNYTKPWFVTVEGKYHLGFVTTPEEGAALVAGWYRDRYGERWRDVVARRLHNPWAVRVVKLQTRTYWVVDVWVAGVPVRVGGSYATRAEATRARRMFGSVLHRGADLSSRPCLLKV